MPLTILFLDFNAYFASVEQQMRPELRGQPVAIVPVMSDSSCCIAASYEAKAFGVKTGTGVSEARMRCPGLILVQARPKRYVEMHHALIAIVEKCMHVEKVCSIDELYCRLTGRWREPERARELAQEIKTAIAAEYPFMRSSIGIAPNVFLAKTASDMHKPNGLTLLDHDALPEALHTLELSDLCGIGKNMLSRLHRHHIHTVEQLTRASRRKLRQIWGGIEGERMHAMLRGHEVWRPPTETGSIGHSHVLPPELRTPQKALGVLHKLLQKAAARLRNGNWYAGQLSVKVKYYDKLRWAKDIRLFETCDTRELAEALETLYERRPWRHARPLFVAVTLSRLVAAHNHTPSLFAKEEKRSHTLNTVMDAVNRQFGPNTLYFASAGEALSQQAAPMRIAFTHVPDLSVERDREQKALPTPVPTHRLPA